MRRAPWDGVTTGFLCRSSDGVHRQFRRCVQRQCTQLQQANNFGERQACTTPDERLETVVRAVHVRGSGSLHTAGTHRRWGTVSLTMRCDCCANLGLANQPAAVECCHRLSLRAPFDGQPQHGHAGFRRPVPQLTMLIDSVFAHCCLRGLTQPRTYSNTKLARMV